MTGYLHCSHPRYCWFTSPEYVYGPLMSTFISFLFTILVSLYVLRVSIGLTAVVHPANVSNAFAFIPEGYSFEEAVLKTLKVNVQVIVLRTA